MRFSGVPNDSPGSLQVRVAQNVVVETVFGKQVGLQVAIECQPVVRQLLRAEHQHAAVAKLVILDDAECRECFSQPNTVGEDAAVEGFQLVDDARCGISLEVEHLVPDQAVFVAGHVVGQNVFVEVFQELVEDVVEHHEVDAFGRILLINRRDMIAEPVRDVLRLFRVVPDLIEQRHESGRCCWLVHLVDDVGDGIALLVAKIHGGKTVQRHVDRIASESLWTQANCCIGAVPRLERNLPSAASTRHILWQSPAESVCS